MRRGLSLFASVAFVTWACVGCAQERHYVGSGYTTSTTSPLHAVITLLKGIPWKREITLGDVATASAAITATIGLWLAWGQLKGLGLQTRAQVLLGMDERWESEEVVELREVVDVFIREVQAEAQRRSRPGRPVIAEALFAAQLDGLQATDRARYSKLIRLCGFWETLGYSARARYIRVHDLHGLLGASIREHAAVFRKHIEKTLQPVRPGILGNFVWLSYEVDLLDRSLTLPYADSCE